MIDIARKIPTLKRIVWSGLEDVSKGSKGKYTLVSHFDGKAAVTAYALTFPDLPFVCVQAGLYASNFLSPFMQPQKEDNGDCVVRLPVVDADTKIPVIDTSGDYGIFVLKGFEHPPASKEILTYGELITIPEMCIQLGKGERRVPLPFHSVNAA